MSAEGETIREISPDEAKKLSESLEKIQTKIDELQQKIDSMSSDEIKNQEKELQEEQRRSILLEKENLEKNIQDQNQNLSLITKSLDTNIENLNVVQSKFNENIENQNKSNEMYLKMCSSVQELYRKKSIAEKMHSDTIQQLEIISQTVLQTNSRYSLLRQNNNYTV